MCNEMLWNIQRLIRENGRFEEYQNFSRYLSKYQTQYVNIKLTASETEIHDKNDIANILLISMNNYLINYMGPKVEIEDVEDVSQTEVHV